MSEILNVEIKSDLEYIYKITGDLLSFLQEKEFTNLDAEIKEILDLIKFRLEDIGGVLQKDIFNCDFLISQDTLRHLRH